jgi:hypothetical protein
LAAQGKNSSYPIGKLIRYNWPKVVEALEAATQKTPAPATKRSPYAADFSGQQNSNSLSRGLRRKAAGQ